MTTEEKLEKALDLLMQVEEAPSSDPTWWEQVFEVSGEHMILTDEGWQSGDDKSELISEYGSECIIREVNACAK